MIERYKRARDNCYVHHVPEVSHESTRMQDKALIQNLNTNLSNPRNTELTVEYEDDIETIIKFN